MGRPKLLRTEDGCVAINQKLKLSGLVFGSLKVIRRASIKDRKNSWWICECLLCGSIKNYRKVELYPERKSCGCNRSSSGNKALDFKGCGEISKSHFTKIKDNAIRKKIEFNITIEEMWDLFIKQNKKCCLSGQDIHFGVSCRSRTKTASLDRIDSRKGYIKENIQWVHKDINYIKYNNSDRELYEICKKVYNFNINNVSQGIVESEIVKVPHAVFWRCKKLSERRKIDWELNHDDLRNLYIKQNYICSLSGEFLYFTDTYTQNTNASLDRIDSSRGYKLDNIQWVSKRINLMKNSFSDQYFIEKCISIYNNLRDKYDKN